MIPVAFSLQGRMLKRNQRKLRDRLWVLIRDQITQTHRHTDTHTHSRKREGSEFVGLTPTQGRTLSSDYMADTKNPEMMRCARSVLQRLAGSRFD